MATIERYIFYLSIFYGSYLYYYYTYTLSEAGSARGFVLTPGALLARAFTELCFDERIMSAFSALMAGN